MIKDDRIYLEHIQESFSKVIEYLEDIGYDAFPENEASRQSLGKADI